MWHHVLALFSSFWTEKHSIVNIPIYFVYKSIASNTFGLFSLEYCESCLQEHDRKTSVCEFFLSVPLSNALKQNWWSIVNSICNCFEDGASWAILHFYQQCTRAPTTLWSLSILDIPSLIKQPVTGFTSPLKMVPL